MTISHRSQIETQDPQQPELEKQKNPGFFRRRSTRIGGTAVALLAAGGAYLSSTGGQNHHEATPPRPQTSTSAVETPGSQETTASTTETQPTSNNPNFAKDPGITINDIVPVAANTPDDQVQKAVEDQFNKIVASGNLQLVQQAAPLVIDQEGGANFQMGNGAVESAQDYLKNSTGEWTANIYNRPPKGYPAGMSVQGPYEMHSKYISSKESVDTSGRKILRVDSITSITNTGIDGTVNVVTPESQGESVFTLATVTLPDGSTESAWVAGGINP